MTSLLLSHLYLHNLLIFLLTYSFYCALSLQKCHYSQYSLYIKKNIFDELLNEVFQVHLIVYLTIDMKVFY